MDPLQDYRIDGIRFAVSAGTSRDSKANPVNAMILQRIHIAQPPFTDVTVWRCYDVTVWRCYRTPLTGRVQLVAPLPWGLE